MATTCACGCASSRSRCTRCSACPRAGPARRAAHGLRRGVRVGFGRAGSKLGELELDPSSTDPMARFQEVMGDPDVILGAVRSPAQQDLLPRLDALVSVLSGYVDHVMDQIGHGLVGSYAQITEALRRRRVEASAEDRFVERLLDLELTQAHFERGSAFVRGVVERAGEDGLARLWSSAEVLPTPNEVDAPGLWLASDRRGPRPRLRLRAASAARGGSGRRAPTTTGTGW
ncbi:MAG: zinc-dependent metalloprotease [Acidimicrobiales bacterium]